jgi:hypothetical protein
MGDPAEDPGRQSHVVSSTGSLTSAKLRPFVVPRAEDGTIPNRYSQMTSSTKWPECRVKIFWRVRGHIAQTRWPLQSHFHPEPRSAQFIE